MRGETSLRWPSAQRVLVVLVLVVGVGMGVVAIEHLVGAARDRVRDSAEVADIFNDVADISPERLAMVEWLPDADTRRPMEPDTRNALAVAWIRSWEARDLYLSTGREEAIEASFSGPALTAVRAAAPGPRIEPIDHQIRLERYSADGLVVAIRVERSRLQREIPIAQSSLWVLSEEQYDAILQLEDGNWRVVHLVRRAADLGTLADPTPAG